MRRRLRSLVACALLLTLASCGFLRDEFWTLDVPPPPLEEGAQEARTR